MTRKPERFGTPTKKDSWAYRDYILKGGYIKFHQMIPSGVDGRKDIPTPSF